MSQYTNTNTAYQQLEATMDREAVLHERVLTLMKTVREEREAAQKEIASLRQECSIKAYYIGQLERARGVNPTLEKIERDLMRMLNATTDALADVAALRSNH